MGVHLIHIRAINNSFGPVLSSLLLSPFRFPVLTINLKSVGRERERNNFKKEKGILKKGALEANSKIGEGD